MPVKFIDISNDPIDYLAEETQEHQQLVIQEALKNPAKFVEEHGIHIASLPEGAILNIRLPMKKEYRFAYGFPPFGEQGEGVGQSSAEQEGEGGSQGQGQGQEEKDKSKEGQEGKGDQGGKERKEQDQRDQGGQEGAKKQRGPTLKRGQEIGRLQRRRRSDLSGGEQGEAEFDQGDGKQEGGTQAGTQPGGDTFETEISIEELRDAVSEQFELPDLKEKKLDVLRVKKKRRPYGYRRKGPSGQLSDVRSARERLKRITSGVKDKEERETVIEKSPFITKDLRYRRREEHIQYLTNAVIFLIRDVSGSMGDDKRNLIRAIATHFIRAVRNSHPTVELVFITHHTEAKERDEWEFFHLGGAGGTKISSGSTKALELIENKYNPEWYNIFTLFFTDGENEPGDNPEMLRTFGELCELSTLFGYFEVYPYYGSLNGAGVLSPLEKMYSSFVPSIVIDAQSASRAFQVLFEAAEKRRKQEET